MVYTLANLRAMDKQYAAVRKALAREVRRRRKTLGISQEQLAFDANLDRTYVSQIERGISNPSLLVLCKLSTVLGADLQELFPRTSDRGRR